MRLWLKWTNESQQSCWRNDDVIVCRKIWFVFYEAFRSIQFLRMLACWQTRGQKLCKQGLVLHLGPFTRSSMGGRPISTACTTSCISCAKPRLANTPFYRSQVLAAKHRDFPLLLVPTPSLACVSLANGGAGLASEQTGWFVYPFRRLFSSAELWFVPYYACAAYILPNHPACCCVVCWFTKRSSTYARLARRFR